MRSPKRRPISALWLALGLAAAVVLVGRLLLGTPLPLRAVPSAPWVAGSCVAKVQRHLASIERLNAEYRCLIETTDAETLLAHAARLDAVSMRGPLFCVLAAVKDNIETDFKTWGLHTAAGNVAVAELLPPADRSAPFMQNLERAGVVVVGKANMDDFALGYQSLSSRGGQTIYPSDKRRFPGGSSGGSAVCVAIGAAELGVGTDTGGSVRIPASFNGLFGLRPSLGAISVDGVVPLSASRDTIGFLAKDPVLINAALRVASASSKQCDLSKPVRVAALTDLFALPDDLEPAFEAALRTLRASELRGVVTRDELAGQKSTSVYEFARDANAYFASRGHADVTVAKCASLTRERGFDALAVQIEKKLVPRSLPSAHVKQWQALKDRLMVLLVEHDALVLPTFSAAPTLLSKHKQQFCPLNRLAASTGLAALSIPVGNAKATGLPIGLEAVSADACVLMRVAARLKNEA